MSMKKMREHTKTFIWIMAIAFVFSTFLLWGMQYSPSMQDTGAPDDTIARVNGKKISYQNFMVAYQNAIDQRQSQNPERELTDQEMVSIRQQTLRDLTDQILFDEQVEKNNIHVTYEEITTELKENPPEFLKSSFMNEDGNFDYDSYMAALRQADDQVLKSIEDALMEYLPRKKLQDKIQASVRVTDLEAWEDFEAQNEKAQVKYLLVDANQIPQESVTVTEAEIQTHYDNNMEDYKQEEQRVADYVMFEVVMTEEDQQELEETKAEILEKIEAGEDFAKLAERYSQDPGSAPKGGDLGFFGKGQMVKPFEDAAFALEDGAVSDWVKSQFGWHLIKKHESKMVKDEQAGTEAPQVHASHILLREEPSVATINAVEEEAYNFVDEVAETPETFADVAEKYDLEIKSTNAVTQRGGSIAGIGRMPDAVNFIFNNEIGSVSGKYDVPGDKGFAIFKVTEVIPEGYKDLSEVETAIRNTLIREKKLAKAKTVADSLYQVVQTGTTLEQIAATDTSYKVETTEEFTRRSYVRNIGRDNEVTTSAFVLPQNKISEPLETPKGYYLIEVVKRQEAQKDNFEKQKEAIKTRLLTQKQNTVFNDWYAEIRDNAKIEDNMEQFFTN